MKKCESSQKRLLTRKQTKQKKKTKKKTKKKKGKISTSTSTLLPPAPGVRDTRKRQRGPDPSLGHTPLSERPCHIDLASGGLWGAVRGDFAERKRVYFCGYYGKGASSRGELTAEDEDQQLHAVEVLYLCMRGQAVVHPSDSPAAELTAEELFRAFTGADAYFPYLFCAYHRLRSRGWVTRTGVKFGADFNLYTDGPARCHAAYCCVVLIHDRDTEQTLPHSRAMNWAQLTSWVRVASSNVKDLMTLHVLVSKEAQRDGLRDITSALEMEVKTHVWSRTAPKVF